MNDDLDRLLAAAERVTAGEELTPDLLADAAVPVALRLLVAATALIAADQPLTKLSMTTAAPAARSAAYRDHSELMARLTTSLPALVAAQLRKVRRDISVTELAARLAKADETIAKERARREAAERELAHVANYARELHWELRPQYEAALRERQEKVRPLHPVPALPDED